MSVITITAAGNAMTRLRTGEHLSAPVAEATDGDGDDPVVLAFLDPANALDGQYDSDADIQTIRTDVTRAVVGAPLGGQHKRDEQRRREQPGRASAERRLRERLVARRKEGLRGLFVALAEEAQAAEEPVELFFSAPVPGGHLKGRLKLHQGRVHARFSLRPAAEGATSARWAKAVVKPPGLVLEADGRMEAGGMVRDLSVEVETDSLPPVALELSSILDRLLTAAPSDAASALRALAAEGRLPSAAPEFALRVFAGLEVLGALLAPGRSAPLFGDVAAWEADSERWRLGFLPSGHLVVEPESRSLPEAALIRDRARLLHLAATFAFRDEV